ncbi:MAG: sugar transferase [Anaerolineales bacterium]|nr:sugar transferase [Anaerolineales bacterium]
MLSSDEYVTFADTLPATTQQWGEIFPPILLAPPTSAWTQPAVEIRPTPAGKRGYLRAKRMFDLIACFLLFPFALILTIIIAYFIWLEDGGPPFFQQTRTGQHGRRFSMFKFRTMVRNAEEMKQQLMHLNELQPPDFKIANDPRVTRVGKFLRRSSLDELPQIINVIKGDMSLVGPRPTSFKAETYEPWQRQRLAVVPGLTGLWQVSGRSELEFDERVMLDIEYIENQSLWLDLRILWQTVGSVFKGRGAY